MSFFIATKKSLRWIAERIALLSFVASSLLIIWGFASKVPSDSVQVRAGVKGAYFETASKRIGGYLKKDGVNIKISNTNDSGNIVYEVSDPNSKIQAGFVAQDLNGIDLANVVSYGVVSVRGMMMFAKGLPDGSEISSFTGDTIFMLPKGSASSQVCVNILDRYFKGFTKPKYVFAKAQPEAIDRYVDSASAGLCIFDDYQSDSIRRAALAAGSVLLTIPDALALAQTSGWLTTKRVPSGTFSTSPRKPNADSVTLGLPVQFLAKANLHIGTETALSRAVLSAFSVNDPIDEREYPYFPGGDTPYSHRAASVYSGGLPWMYRFMWFSAAATTDAVLSAYGIWFAVLYFLTNLYMFAGFATPVDVFQRRRMRSNERFIAKLSQTSLHSPINKRDQRRLERLQLALGRNISNETTVLESINEILDKR